MKNILLLIILASLGFTGCLTAGSRKMDPDKFTHIQPGKTTLNDLEGWFGKPFSQSRAGLMNIAFWDHIQTHPFGQTESQVLGVRLDLNNVVIESVATNSIEAAIAQFQLTIGQNYIALNQQRDTDLMNRRIAYLSDHPDLKPEIHNALEHGQFVIGLTKDQALLIAPLASRHTTITADGATEECMHYDTHLFFHNGVLFQISE